MPMKSQLSSNISSAKNEAAKLFRLILLSTIIHNAERERNGASSSLNTAKA